jgi:hypothetical protein
MSLRRYLFEWYSVPVQKNVRHLLRAADAKDAMVLFEKAAESGTLLNYSGGAYSVQAVAEDACADCYGTGRVDRQTDGHFNIICSACYGKGVAK